MGGVRTGPPLSAGSATERGEGADTVGRKKGDRPAPERRQSYGPMERLRATHTILDFRFWILDCHAGQHNA